jgi:hypothetical protein
MSNVFEMQSAGRTMPPVGRAQSRAIHRIVIGGILVVTLAASSVHAAPPTAEDLLADTFDKTTGVPFASTMLALIRTGEHTPQSPEALDARLSAIEALLRDMEPRLKLVEQRLLALENEVVKVSNINRLRTLQRISSELAEINTELRQRPADAGARAILEFRARQQADLIKNDPELDVWKLSDVIVAAEPVRTRFFVYPTFELYTLAIHTWLAAIELNSGTQPQRVVTQLGSFLRDHQAFLETRAGLPEILDKPVTLPENLHAAAFCRLEAVDTFSNAAGGCVFASVCIDAMAEKRVETDRQTITVQPPKAGTLCTSNPGQSVGLQGEDELRNAYGQELMAALADALARLATTGSLGDPFVGQFPNFIQTQIFSVPLGGPLLSSSAAAPGTLPAIPKCTPVIGGCSFGVQLSQKTGWTVANTNPKAVGGGGGFMTIRNNGNTLCLDVKNSAAAPAAPVVLWPCNGSASQVWNKVLAANAQYTLAAGNTTLCATVAPAAAPGNFQLTSRSLTLQTCNRGPLQQFSNSDGQIVGPH